MRHPTRCRDACPRTQARRERLTALALPRDQRYAVLPARSCKRVCTAALSPSRAAWRTDAAKHHHARPGAGRGRRARGRDPVGRAGDRAASAATTSCSSTARHPRAQPRGTRARRLPLPARDAGILDRSGEQVPQAGVRAGQAFRVLLRRRPALGACDADRAAHGACGRSPTSAAASAPGRRRAGRSRRRPTPSRRREAGAMALKLIIGNKNYSSWSLRPWIAMKVAGIAFEEEVISLDAKDFKARVSAVLGHRQGAGAGRRRRPRLGVARDPRISRREISASRPVAGRCRRRARMPARSPPRCMPASCRCAGTCR